MRWAIQMVRWSACRVSSFDGTAEIVSIPDHPMMAAVIMSGMLAGGCKDKGAALVNKALHLADLILDEIKTKED